MKSGVGKELLKSLFKTTDVLVENFCPDVMAHLGLDFDVLKKENVNLIYCSISGFGQIGSRADDPAYDQIIQGFAGIMSITGSPDTQPCLVGYPIADTSGGIAAAISICAPLNANPRGAFLDISMMDAMLSSMGWVVSNYVIGGLEPAANGNENVSCTLWNVFDS